MSSELDPQCLDHAGDEVVGAALGGEAEAAAALFVHGVSSHLLGGGDEVVARRIAAALGVIDAEPARPAHRWQWAVAVAAALLAALLVWALLPGGRAPTLSATVRAARLAAEAPVDRQYQLSITLGSDRRVDGTMTVRGRDRFVVAVGLPPGPFVFGCDGTSSWAVPPLPGLPVRTAEGIGRAREALAGDGVALPFHSLATFLQQLERDFELSAVATGELVRLSGDPRQPGGDERFTVAVDIEAATGVVRMLQLDWPGDRPPRAPRSLRLEWLAEPTLAPNFYGHVAHHAADRTVVEFR
ncbi:MAG: hypothetical protein ACK595_21795 [Planctomycetota bacterium]|jgi:hypothetical protein